MDERKNIEKLVAPDYEQRKMITNTIKDISYYLIIGIISLILIFIVPLISGCLYGDISLAFPSTLEGWIIYLTLRIGLSCGNVSIFVLFKLQAKTNVKNNPNYLQAMEILNKEFKKLKALPRSPKQMNSADYAGKGVSVFLGTLAATITISSLIISFDFITFLSCIISTIMTICFSWVTMLNNEMYWTDEFLSYAKMIQNKEVNNG